MSPTHSNQSPLLSIRLSFDVISGKLKVPTTKVRLKSEEAIQYFKYKLNQIGEPSDSAMGRVKLMKLLFLAEAQSLKELNRPLFGDALFSYKNGPVLGALRKVAPIVNVGLAPWKPNLLSEIETDVLVSIWSRHGRTSGAELIEYTHASMFGWESPSIFERCIYNKPLNLEKLFEGLNLSDDQQLAIAEGYHFLATEA